MEDNKVFKYKFSIIMSIYNVEDYLEEAIDSIVNQSLGFKENVQLILINDGSPDNSEEICLKYKRLYPNNIIYKKKENGGLASARNFGINFADGKYVNFFDPDDILDNDVLDKVYRFFEKNYDKIDLVGIRVKFFEAMQGYKHPADYKFNKDRIVNVLEDYDAIHLQGAVSFIKNDIAKENKFDERLDVSEDFFYVSKIIIDKGKYGIMKSAVYNYRRRFSGTSILNTSKQNKSWYFDTPNYAYKQLFEYSKKIYNGEVIPYVQYAVMYDLQWRIKNKISDILSDTEKIKYIKTIQELLNEIDDDIILKQRNLFIEYRIYALCLKYNRDIRKELKYRKNKLYFNNNEIFNLESKKLVIINIMEIRNDKLYIEGESHSIVPEEDYNIYVLNNKNKKYNLKYYDISFKETYGLNNELLKSCKRI